MEPTTTPPAGDMWPAAIHGSPSGRRCRAGAGPDFHNDAAAILAHRARKDRAPHQPIVGFTRSAQAFCGRVAFESEVIAGLQAALFASQACPQGARLDALAMALNTLFKKCSAHAKALEEKAQAMNAPDGDSPSCAQAVHHARCLTEAARSVADLVRARALALNDASIKALWKASRH